MHWPEEIVRNRGALTEKEQRRLGSAHVCVVGCGGLGGFVIEELVRTGIRRLTLFDPDVFDRTNINRQLNADLRSLGRNKAEVAGERAQTIAIDCAIDARQCDFRSDPVDFSGFDVVVDCLDGNRVRHDLAVRCRTVGIALVHGAVRQWYGQVGVQLPGSGLIGQLYPLHQLEKGGKQPVSVLASTVALVASLQVAETVKLLAGIASPLLTHWLSIDLRHCDFELFPTVETP